MEEEKHFWDLSYWSTNMIRNNLDVMHIEKNFFDIIFNTLMCVPGKTKDHLKARQWYDQTTTGYSHRTRIHLYKLVNVYIGRSYRKYDRFVLASHASQVYYLHYPSLRQNMKDW